MAASLFLLCAPHPGSSSGRAQMQSPQALVHFCVRPVPCTYCSDYLNTLPEKRSPHSHLPLSVQPHVPVPSQSDFSREHGGLHACVSPLLLWHSHCRINAMKAKLTVPQLLNSPCWTQSGYPTGKFQLHDPLLRLEMTITHHHDCGDSYWDGE